MYTWEHATNTPAEPLGAPSSQAAAVATAATSTSTAAAPQEPSAQAASPRFLNFLIYACHRFVMSTLQESFERAKLSNMIQSLNNFVFDLRDHFLEL